MNNTIENNKLIADFMGKEYHSPSAIRKELLEQRNDGIHYSIDLTCEDELDYHKNWNSLIEVYTELNRFIIFEEPMSIEVRYECTHFLRKIRESIPDINRFYNEIVDTIKYIQNEE